MADDKKKQPATSFEDAIKTLEQKVVELEKTKKAPEDAADLIEDATNAAKEAADRTDSY